MERTTQLLSAMALILGLAVVAGVLVVGVNGVASATGQETTSSSATMANLGESEGRYAEGVIEIVLGEAITVSGEGANAEGSTVSITAAGVYSISGTLTDGQIDVDTEGKVYLEFDGVSIASNSGPALSITDAKKVTLTLVAGTVNSLTDAQYDDSSDAALFTNDTLVINGEGTLMVSGNNNEGISSDDDLIINSGTIKVTAVDDGLNAHDDITINGGDVCILAGGDGLDSNGTVNINGGMLVSFGNTTGGDGGLDTVGAFTITGGILIAGGNAMASPESDSTQCSLYVATGSIKTAGTTVRVEREGEVVLMFAPDKEFQNLLISSSSLIKDATYQVYVGDSAVALSATAGTTTSSAGDSTPASAGGRAASR